MGRLFGVDDLELLRLMKVVVRIGLGLELSLLGFLHKVFVSLLLGEPDGILLALEVQVGALHVIGGRLPAHQRVLPTVALGKNIPVHAPVVAVPCARLSSWLGRAVDSVQYVWSARRPVSHSVQLSSIPHSSGLQIRRGTRQDSGSDGLARLAAIHDALRDGGEVPARKRTVSHEFLRASRAASVRCAEVDGSIVVWLVTSHCLRGSLLSDQGALLRGRRRRIGRAGLDILVGRRTLRGTLNEAGVHRRPEPAHSEAGRASDP